MQQHITSQNVDSLLPPFALYNLNEAVRNGSAENPTMLKDIATLLRHCAAENRAGNDPLCLIHLPDGSVFVSGKIYQWSLSFHAIATSKAMIEEITSAVKFNSKKLQPKITDHSNAINQYNAKRTELAYKHDQMARDWAKGQTEAQFPDHDSYFHGPDKEHIRNFEQSLYTGYMKQNPMNDFIEANIKKELTEYEKTYNRVWVGAHGLHPRQYLDSLGITSFPEFLA